MAAVADLDSLGTSSFQMNRHFTSKLWRWRLIHYWSIVRLRRRLIILAFAIGVLFSLGVSLFSSPVFISRVSVYVEPDPISFLSFQSFSNRELIKNPGNGPIGLLLGVYYLLLLVFLVLTSARVSSRRRRATIESCVPFDMDGPDA